MLLCDRAIIDSATGQVSLIDIRGEFVISVMPFAAPALYVYARLTDAIGSYAITVDLVRRDDFTEIAAGRAWILEFADPLEELEVIGRIEDAVLTQTGYYDVRLWANGRFVHSASLRLTEVESDDAKEP